MYESGLEFKNPYAYIFAFLGLFLSDLLELP